MRGGRLGEDFDRVVYNFLAKEVIGTGYFTDNVYLEFYQLLKHVVKASKAKAGEMKKLHLKIKEFLILASALDFIKLVNEPNTYGYSTYQGVTFSENVKYTWDIAD
jgi:hypothetical protein